MSTHLCRPFRLFGLILVFGGFLLRGATAAPPVPTVLWNEGAERGQWFPFGQGMQDAAVLPEGKGLRMIVDWKDTTYGVGARYAANAKDPTSKPLPKMTGFHKLQFQARCERDDHTVATVELVTQQNDKAVRADKDATKTLTTAWQTLEFAIPSNFPDLGTADLSAIDAIRLLFMNPEKAGSNSVEFRNVTLLP